MCVCMCVRRKICSHVILISFGFVTAPLRVMFCISFCFESFKAVLSFVLMHIQPHIHMRVCVCVCMYVPSPPPPA